MSAKPLETKKHVENATMKPIAELKKAILSQDEVVIHKKIISDQLNSEKAKKDVQIRTVDELEKRIKSLQAEIDALVIDFNHKRAINENLGASIASAHSNLSMLDRKFAEANAKMLAQYEKKMAEVVEADKQLQQLLKETREKEQDLERQRGLFESERVANRQLLHAAESALTQNNAQWKNIEADLLIREAELKKQKEDFESYKESLQPEISRITSIKNENALYLQKIEQQRLDMENQRLAVVREREAMEEKLAIANAATLQERERIKARDAELRNWEQNLKDYDLEIRAKNEEANRILRREKLEKELNA